MPLLFFVELFDDGHSDWCKIMPHCSFGLRICKSDVEHLFVPMAIYVSSLEKCLLGLCPFFDWVLCFFDIELRELLVCFGD